MPYLISRPPSNTRVNSSAILSKVPLTVASLKRHLLRLLAAIPTPLKQAPVVTGGRGRGINKMAWRSHGSTNDELIDQLWRNGLIKDERVKEAFLKVLPYRQIYFLSTRPPLLLGHSATPLSHCNYVTSIHSHPNRSTEPTTRPPRPTATTPNP